jgi:hypothetical protein
MIPGHTPGRQLPVVKTIEGAVDRFFIDYPFTTGFDRIAKCQLPRKQSV